MSVEVIKEKNSVLVPIKDWEKTQKELIRLRKQVNKAKVLRDIKEAILTIEQDLARNPRSRRIRKTADEFLAEFENGE